MLLKKLTPISILAWGCKAAPGTPIGTSTSSYSTLTTSSTTVISSTSTASSSATSSVPSNGTDACASVAALAAATTNASPSATPTVPAQLAYQCLTSIPFNNTAALLYLESVDPYVVWQSTLDYVRSPPAQYAANVQAPYDFYIAWTNIKTKASANAYRSEYEFGFEIYRTFQKVHDNHFGLIPDSAGLFFTFGRDMPLVSLSLDGKSLPQPYLYTDVLLYGATSGSFIPSPIIQINGEDADSFLLNLSSYTALQDPDAAWNRLFYSPAQTAQGPAAGGTGIFNGGGSGQLIYPGPSTTLGFANGSSLTRDNYARVMVPFDGITSGADLYANFLVPPPEAYQSAFDAENTPPPDGSTPATTSLAAPAYPTPFVSTGDNSNSGYFIDEPGYEDVAVLAVRTFVAQGPIPQSQIDYQGVNTYFIETAAAMGKKKLILDLSANGGGLILQGYDLFKILFPSILPYGGTRFRAHEALDLMGEQDSYLSGFYQRTLENDNATYGLLSSTFNYRTDSDVDYQPFTSWPEKYNPSHYGPGDTDYTSIFRFNLSDPLVPDESGGIDVSGYRSRTNITAQPFAAENIIIAGVKTVALGGRPKDGIIQAIGGTKGGESYNYVDNLFSTITNIYARSNASLQSGWQNTVLQNYTALPIYRSLDTGLNVRNSYRQGDASNTPLQFVYQPADCRILYTPSMLLDETAVWKAVADSAWGRGSSNACVAGKLSGNGNGDGQSPGNGWSGVSVKNSTGVRGGTCRPIAPHSSTVQKAWTNVDYKAITDSFSLESEHIKGRVGRLNLFS